ncbi:MAG: metallophosphoesterase [Promethearchaeota archaeon]
MSKQTMKQYFMKMPAWKRALWVGLVVWTAVMVPVAILWFFSLSGVAALFKWTPPLWAGVAIFLAVAVLAPLISYIDFRGAWKKEKAVYSPRRAIWALCLVGLVMPITFFGYFGTAINNRAGDKAPQLLVADGTGAHDIPDMAVTFWTQAATKNKVKWGPGALSNEIVENASSHQHAFMLRDLLPDTEYWYQINEQGDIYKFTTPPGTNDTFKFAMTSDCHFGRPASRNDITAAILGQVVNTSNGYDMLFFGGDFVETGNDDSMWKTGLDAISNYTTRIPFRPAIGNHDDFFGGTQLYQEYFYPQGMDTDTGSRLYYRIDINNVHVFVLDLEWGTETYTAAQKAWFEEQIVTVPKDDWTIVVNHCMYYTSGVKTVGIPWWDIKEMIDEFEPTFIEHDVDLVFSGHNHHAEVLQKDGVTYAVAGTFGGVPDPEREYASKYSLWYKANTFGFMSVDIAGTTANLEFRDPSNHVLYQLTVQK